MNPESASLSAASLGEAAGVPDGFSFGPGSWSASEELIKWVLSTQARE